MAKAYILGVFDGALDIHARHIKFPKGVYGISFRIVASCRKTSGYAVIELSRPLTDQEMKASMDSLDYFRFFTVQFPTLEEFAADINSRPSCGWYLLGQKLIPHVRQEIVDRIMINL